MSDIQETIEHLRRLDQVASPAPWGLEPYRDGGVEEEEETSEPKVHSIANHQEDVIAQLGCGCCDTGLGAPSMANFEIAVEARNAIPALLAEIERLTEENLKLKRENHLAWSKGHAAGWDSHIITMQSADLLPKPDKDN